MDVFRGFECVEGVTEGDRDNLGYLHAVLGGDDPGRVLWAPKVFDMAKEFGLILMEDGSLVDTIQGEEVSKDKNPMPVTSQAQIDEHRVISSEALESIVIRISDFDWGQDTVLAQFEGVQEVSLVGGDSPAEGISTSKLGWKHGFVVRGLKLQSGASVPAHKRAEEEVIFVHQGAIKLVVDGEKIELSEGDNFTTPIGSVRSFENIASGESIYYVTRGGDQPTAPQFDL
ncbi:cupin domain-containing protein [Psychrobium sp. nBUS_13]|uniref:cupin domain-containing protein n=1 Tax=Psychrobium sp. nBUS_13 TaxID=3395319 RepID=UPI003EBCC034